MRLCAASENGNPYQPLFLTDLGSCLNSGPCFFFFHAARILQQSNPLLRSNRRLFGPRGMAGGFLRSISLNLPACYSVPPQSLPVLLLHFIHYERTFLPVQQIVKVTAAIISSNGRVLIAQRKAEHHQAGKWEFPGGKIESGETPEECLRRELKEEFDIDTRVGAFLGASLYPYDHKTIELLAFRVVWEDGILLVREHARVEWVRIGQLARFDFAPADVPFVEKLLKGEIAL